MIISHLHSSTQTMIPTNPYNHVNEHLPTVDQTRRQTRRRTLISILIITGFIIGIILVLALTAGRITTPKFRIRSATFGTFNIDNNTTTPSFNIQMDTEVGIRNRNFRRFRYRDTTVEFFYRDRKVGEGRVWDDRVRGRDTRKFRVPVILSSANVTSVSELGSDVSGGVLTFRSRSRLTGKFKILIFFRRYKHVNMDCSMEVVIASRELRNISCR